MRRETEMSCSKAITGYWVLQNCWY